MMNDYIQPKQRVPKPPRKPFLWLCLTAIVIGILLGWFAEVRAEPMLSSPICPSGIWVIQRYDTWREVDGQMRIVRSRWRGKCYMQPLMIRWRGK